jgi:anti-anti-sigma factor
MDPAETDQVRNDGTEDLPLHVTLTGELDVRYQQILENVLDDCVSSGRFALIDLSGVTFMDSRCVRELAIQYLLSDGRLVLCDPSREVALSVAACELEDCLDFFCTTDSAYAGRPADGRLRPLRGEDLVGDRGPYARHDLQRVSPLGYARREAGKAARAPLPAGGWPRDGEVLVTGAAERTRCRP